MSLFARWVSLDSLPGAFVSSSSQGKLLPSIFLMSYVVRTKGEQDVLGSLELDVHVLAGVHEQVLVVGGLLDDVGAQGVARLPVVEVVEALQPLGEAGRLAVGAGPRDRVPDVAGG